MYSADRFVTVGWSLDADGFAVVEDIGYEDIEARFGVRAWASASRSRPKAPDTPHSRRRQKPCCHAADVAISLLTLSVAFGIRHDEPEA